MENLYIILLLILIGYFALYFGGRKYLETFKGLEGRQDGRLDGLEGRLEGRLEGLEDGRLEGRQDGRQDGLEGLEGLEGQKDGMEHFQNLNPEMQYPSGLNKDTYELSQIFNNQGSKTASKKQISDAMTRYPLDWSVQGPNSQIFQENQAKYESKKRVDPEPFINQPADMLLPDAAALEDEEQKILKTYKPESSKGLLHYSMHDVTHLLKKIYDKKGLIPVIEKSKQGENIWEIVEVKEKNPKIVWEDDGIRDKMTARGENVIGVPYTASDIAAGMDPFMHTRNRVRAGRHAIKENTELGRMFQTIQPVPQWN